MAGTLHPIYRDNIPVSKSNARDSTVIRLGTADDLRAFDGTNAWVVYVHELQDFFERRTDDTTSLDDGETVLVDANGARWYLSEVTYTPLVDGGVAKPAVMKFHEEISVRDFLTYSPNFQVEVGSKSEQIADFLMGGSGSKILNVTGGRYLLQEAAAFGYGIYVESADNISIIGDSRETCIFKVDDGADIGLLAIERCNNVHIKGISFDGNRDNNSSSEHGLRFGGECRNVTVDQFKILKALNYALGAQTTSEGDDAFIDFLVSNFLIEDSGNDCIDFKDPNELNDNIRILNGIARNANRNNISSARAVVDIRGKRTQVANLRLELTDRPNMSLLRLRAGGSDLSAYSTIRQVTAIGSVDATGARHTGGTPVIGIDMESSNCLASGNEVIDCDWGYSMGAPSKSVLSDSIAEGCYKGIRSIADSTSTIANTIVNNSISSPYEFGGDVRLYNTLLGTDHWIVAEKGASGIAGEKWIESDVRGWADTNGVTQHRYETNGLLNMSGLAAGDFSQTGRIMLNAGSSAPAISVRANSTAARRVGSFETTMGVKRTIWISDADGLYVADAAGTKLFKLLTADDATTITGTADDLLTTPKGVKAAIDARIAALDVQVFKGAIDCSANPNYPAANAGDTYRVSVAGKIGGGSGPNVEVNDMLICLADSTALGTHAGVGASWAIIQSNLDGAVIGPSAATNNSLARFDGTTGKLLKDGAVIGVDVQAYDANTTKNNVEEQVMTGGFRVTSKDLGTISSGTTTLDPGDRPLQHCVNGGAFTLAPGSNRGSILLDITNNGSAGAITTSGWTKVVGAFDTVNGNKFRCHASIGEGGSLLQIQELQ
jgi:hypothetical protein